MDGNQQLPRSAAVATAPKKTNVAFTAHAAAPLAARALIA
jgi:hypothetical protein